MVLNVAVVWVCISLKVFLFFAGSRSNRNSENVDEVQRLGFKLNDLRSIKIQKKKIAGERNGTARADLIQQAGEAALKEHEMKKKS